MTRIAAMSIGLSLLLAGCSESRDAASFAVGERTVSDVTDTVLVVGGSEQDTTFFMPTMLSFLNDGIVVWDRDRAQVLFFDEDGVPRWRYGGKGSGPGEFSGVTQIAADDDGRLWVLDVDNVRITLLDGDGSLVRAFSIPDVGYADRIVPISEGRALLLGLDPMIHTIDDHGALLGSRPHPYSAYASLHPMSAYNRPVRDPDSDSTAFFFYYGGGFAGTDDALTPTGTLNAYVENIPFPEVTMEQSEGDDGSIVTTSQVNATRLAAKSGTADGGVLHLLFQGDTEYGNRLIDNYSIGSGEYLGSWLLPDTANAIAVHDGLVATLVETPYPALVVRRAPGS